MQHHRRAPAAAAALCAVTLGTVACLPSGAPVPWASGDRPPLHSPDSGAAQVATGTVTISLDASHTTGAIINRNLIGVDGPGPGQDNANLGALGMRWIRLDASLEGRAPSGKPDYNCSTGAWDPSDLDGRMAEVHAIGAQPLVIVDYTPTCLATDVPPGTNPSYAAPDLGANGARWRTLVEEMAYHEITAEGVRAFEVWNEPDLGFFWTAGLPAYEWLYNVTSRALEAAAGDAGVRIEVGGPGMAFDNTFFLTPFLSYVVANGLPLDFVSWHWYANDPDVGPFGPVPMPNPIPAIPSWYNPALSTTIYSGSTELVRSVLAGFPSLHAKLWIDEWNVDAGFDPRMSGPYGAAFAASALEAMQAVGLNRSCWFDTVDSSNDLRANWGLLTSSYQPKPAYEAFGYWHDLAPKELVTAVSPDQSGDELSGQIGAVASADGAGRVTILVSNFTSYDAGGNYGATDPTPYDHPVTVTITGLTHEPYAWQRDETDGAHPQGAVVGGGLVASAGSLTLTFTATGEGVTLLVLVPANRA